MTTLIGELETWFSQRPVWIQEAAKRLLEKGSVSLSDISELTILCKQEAGSLMKDQLFNTARAVSNKDFGIAESRSELIIKSLLNIKGINALSPKKPLDLGSTLTVIYGSNGSGKSGYTRLLKHICGAKNPGVLHNNVFVSETEVPSCTIKCLVNNNECEINWNGKNGVIEELSTVEIYDSDCANVYVNEENEVAYEPYILRLFTQLVDICSKVNQALVDEKNTYVSSLPQLPPEFKQTNHGMWYCRLNYNISSSEVNRWCLWADSLESEVLLLKQRIAEPNPQEKEFELNKTKKKVEEVIRQLEKIMDLYSDDKCLEYTSAVSDYEEKRIAAEVDAIKVFNDAPLSGIGTESWKHLWEKAREYSEQEAYKGIQFPNTSEGARCILCQQVLSNEAHELYTSFESFVKGALTEDSQRAADKVKRLENNFKDIPKKELLILSVMVSPDSKKFESGINAFYETIEKRCAAIIDKKALMQIHPLPTNDFIDEMREFVICIDKNLDLLKKDTVTYNRDSLKKQLIDLEARKWLYQQIDSINNEVCRLKNIKGLDDTRQLANTQAISVKKSNLADELITAAYIERFQHEINALSASRIPVEITKTRTSHGRVYHQIRLKDCRRQVSSKDILSEGEYRVISLATFIADAEGRLCQSPFVFDDPISSLDQDFEEATVRRLVSLANKRQIVIFTHRLSLVALVEAEAKRQDLDVDIINLRAENWGKGEPGDTPLRAKNPLSALTVLINERIPRAKKSLEIGRLEYEELAKGIVSDFRILLERFIEIELLSDVVQRFRRAVNTLNKIQYLSLITSDDCKLFDEMMTKYSKYEHSQPYELPVPLPDPHEIERDMLIIKQWCEEFKGRKN